MEHGGRGSPEFGWRLSMSPEKSGYREHLSRERVLEFSFLREKEIS